MESASSLISLRFKDTFAPELFDLGGQDADLIRTDQAAEGELRFLDSVNLFVDPLFLLPLVSREEHFSLAN